MALPDEQRLVRILLRFLAVAHFAIAILAAGALLFIWMTYRDAAVHAANPNRVAELEAVAGNRATYIGTIVVAALALVGGVASGILIWRHRHRRFSRAVAVLSLLLFPIGTAIGVATGTINAQEAFIKGRILLTGNQQHLMDSVPVFKALDTVFNTVRQRTSYE